MTRQMYLWSNELAERGKRKMEKKNVSFSKDGMRVGVKQINDEDYADRTQRYVPVACCWEPRSLAKQKSIMNRILRLSATVTSSAPGITRVSRLTRAVWAGTRSLPIRSRMLHLCKSALELHLLWGAGDNNLVAEPRQKSLVSPRRSRPRAHLVYMSPKKATSAHLIPALSHKPSKACVVRCDDLALGYRRCAKDALSRHIDHGE